MFSSALRSTILPLSLIVSFGADAARGVLKADGIIRVKGADVSTTSVTVVPGNAAAYLLPIGSKHITLSLPLDDVYLVCVQREGCPSKEVYFDTRVPVDMHAAEFQFPFMVSLEHLSPERMFAYAAPVGFVRYVHGLKDFGYETHYVVQVEEKLKQRMQEIQETGVDPMVMAPTRQALVIDRPKGEYHAPTATSADLADGRIVPMVSEVPRLVHVVSAAPAVEESARSREVALPMLSPMITVLRTAPLPTPQPVGAALASIAVAPTFPVVEAPLAIKTLPVTSLLAAHSESITAPLTMGEFSRTEELIAEARRVTRIVRYTQANGSAQEYRMVTHAFGGVYYFHGSRSITERDFLLSVAQDVIATRNVDMR